MDEATVETLALRFETPNKTFPDLQQHVQQLIRERGALRHINRQSLQAEIDRPTVTTESTPSGRGNDEPESDDETPQARQERLWKAREDMLKKLNYAQNEILSALDFVSLLLSGKSAAAQSSMSPALKERVPVGSLDENKVKEQSLSSSARQKLSQVSEGWKSQSFKEVSAKFTQASSKLESEARNQSKYWDQIAGLKGRGWPISRLPSDGRTVGVHYGFPESAPQFRKKGVALLHQNDSGSLQLDARSIPESRTTIKVNIVRDGVETGVSYIHPHGLWKEDDIGEQVKRVREAIFEEELLHEINRGARLIANQGVRSQLRAVEADVDAAIRIRIVQSELDCIEPQAITVQDGELAESIAVNMRLLLLLEHEKSRKRRSKPPVAMSLTPPVAPEYALLRPILAQLRHQTLLSVLKSRCESFSKTFTTAGLQFHHKLNGNQDAEDQHILQLLRQPARSLLILSIAEGRKLELEIETYLGPPIYGTIFRSKSLDFKFIHLQATTFNQIKEAIDHMAHVLTLELMSQTSDFEVLRPHSGEVSVNASTRLTATVSVRSNRLSLLVAGPSKVAYSWRPTSFQRIPAREGGGGVVKSFTEVVGDLAGPNAQMP